MVWATRRGVLKQRLPATSTAAPRPTAPSRRARPAAVPSMHSSTSRSFHGEIRYVIGYRPLVAGGKPGEGAFETLRYTNHVLTSQAGVDRLVEKVNRRTYSMQRGGGGKPIHVPLQSAKINFARHALLVVVADNPCHSYDLESWRSVGGAAGHYAAAVALRKLPIHSTPSCLGHFSAWEVPLLNGPVQLVTLSGAPPSGSIAQLGPE
ncbi:hypothetical protein AB1Y20_010657 [Prymnesium parvum]|uniref:Uncharacterized protein n=1 Tax=Prymnesium parvum TaxID=97485 RepID=A0AB34IST4_PRYPA